MTAEHLQQQLSSELAARRTACITRVLVLEEASSTQDVARARAADTPGLAVLALSQHTGRGRLGRRWAATQGLGLAMTLALPGTLTPGRLSLVAGLAACRTCESALLNARSSHAVGLRWPNDVVEVQSPQRKLAGVLIERIPSLHLVGIGINLHQFQHHWPQDLARRAVSLAQLGAPVSLVSAAAELLFNVDAALDLPEDALAGEWSRRNVLLGRRCTFEHDARRFTGEVREINPNSHISLFDDAQGLVQLPALTTSLVHDA